MMHKYQTHSRSTRKVLNRKSIIDVRCMRLEQTAANKAIHSFVLAQSEHSIQTDAHTSRETAVKMI